MNRRVFSGLLAALSLVVVVLASGARAQQRSAQFFIEPLSDARGQVGLGLALRKLTTVGTFMHTTAHPDDENNAVLAFYARGQGMRVASQAPEAVCVAGSGDQRRGTDQDLSGNMPRQVNAEERQRRVRHGVDERAH